MNVLLNSNMLLLNSVFTGPHMIFLLALVVLLFGGKKIPELAKGLGQGIREFNKAKDGAATEAEAPAVKELPKN